MARKPVAVVEQPGQKGFLVFCDDGTVWQWYPSSTRTGEAKWVELLPPLPQDEAKGGVATA